MNLHSPQKRASDGCRSHLILVWCLPQHFRFESRFQLAYDGCGSCTEVYNHFGRSGVLPASIMFVQFKLWWHHDLVLEVPDDLLIWKYYCNSTLYVYYACIDVKNRKYARVVTPKCPEPWGTPWLRDPHANWWMISGIPLAKMARHTKFYWSFNTVDLWHNTQTWMDEVGHNAERFGWELLLFLSCGLSWNAKLNSNVPEWVTRVKRWINLGIYMQKQSWKLWEETYRERSIIQFKIIASILSTTTQGNINKYRIKTWTRWIDP